jgi:hypothetical protein
MDIKLAIDSAIKGDLKTSLKSLSTQTSSILNTIIDPATFRRSSDAMNFFVGPDGQERLFNYSGHESAIKAYTTCPPVSAIIDRKAQAYINGKTWILNTKGKESFTPEAKQLRKLFTLPNPV